MASPDSTLPKNLYVFRQKILTYGAGLFVLVETDASIVIINSQEYTNDSGHVSREFPPTEHDLHVVVEADASRLSVHLHLKHDSLDSKSLDSKSDRSLPDQLSIKTDQQLVKTGSDRSLPDRSLPDRSLPDQPSIKTDQQLVKTGSDRSLPDRSLPDQPSIKTEPDQQLVKTGSDRSLPDRPSVKMEATESNLTVRINKRQPDLYFVGMGTSPLFLPLTPCPAPSHVEPPVMSKGVPASLRVYSGRTAIILAEISPRASDDRPERCGLYHYELLLPLSKRQYKIVFESPTIVDQPCWHFSLIQRVAPFRPHFRHVDDFKLVQL